MYLLNMDTGGSHLTANLVFLAWEHARALRTQAPLS